MKFIRIVIDIFITITAFSIIFFINLNFTILGTYGPDQEPTIALLFSKENIIKTLIGLAVAAAIVLPIRWAIMKRIGENQNE
jgi:hypothetical protein